MTGILTRYAGESIQERKVADEPRYWDEDDPRAFYYAVIEACWVYRYRDLRENLWNLPWRKARRRVLAHGALSNEWAHHRRADVRLKRRGLEVRFRNGTKVLGWSKLQEFVRAERL